jgi:hypothetical protein
VPAPRLPRNNNGTVRAVIGAKIDELERFIEQALAE